MYYPGGCRTTPAPDEYLVSEGIHSSPTWGHIENIQFGPWCLSRLYGAPLYCKFAARDIVYLLWVAQRDKQGYHKNCVPDSKSFAEAGWLFSPRLWTDETVMTDMFHTVSQQRPILQTSDPVGPENHVFINCNIPAVLFILPTS